MHSVQVWLSYITMDHVATRLHTSFAFNSSQISATGSCTMTQQSNELMQIARRRSRNPRAINAQNNVFLDMYIRRTPLTPKSQRVRRRFSVADWYSTTRTCTVLAAAATVIRGYDIAAVVIAQRSILCGGILKGVFQVIPPHILVQVIPPQYATAANR